MSVAMSPPKSRRPVYGGPIDNGDAHRAPVSNWNRNANNGSAAVDKRSAAGIKNRLEERSLLIEGVENRRTLGKRQNYHNQ